SPVDRSRDEFFPGAGLAGDEDCRVAAGDFGYSREHGRQRRRSADKPLCEVELRLLAFFDVESAPDPVEDRSVVPSKGLRATEEPAVVAFSAADPKTHLTGTAGAQTF